MYVTASPACNLLTFVLSCYSALGIPQDASDELVSLAYQEQVRTNTKEGPTYLSYLRQIAEIRGSELLETVVATEYSADKFDSKQLNEAYQYFSLSPRDNGVTDDLILGSFQARLQDSAKHEAEMRAHLRVIGAYRGSQRIKDVAQDGELPLESSIWDPRLITTSPQH